MHARWSFAFLGLAAIAIMACGTANPESIYTELHGGACREQTDAADPNETKFLVCPGVGGYSLYVRPVEAGRESVDVAGPQGNMMPLAFVEKISPSMNSLPGKAEWRVRNGKPLGLLIPVELREDIEDPARVSRMVWAVARIGERTACLTALEAKEELARQAADKASEHPCLGDRQP